MHQLFFRLLLLLLPTQLGYHFWPDWALVLGRKVDYLSPTIYLTDVLVFFIVGSWLLTKISNIKYQISNIHIKYKKLLTPIFLIFLIVLNIFLAINKPVAVYKWIKVGEFFLLGWYIVRTKPSLSSIVYPLSISVLYSSVIAIGQFIFQRSIGGPLWWLGERTFNIDTPGIARIDLNLSLITYHLSLFKLRPYGTFPHPNVLGGYLAAALPLIIIQLANYPILKLSNKKNLFYLSTIVLGVIALLLSFSRSAIVVGIIAMVVTWLNIKYQILNIKKILPPHIIAIGIVFFVALLSLVTYHLSPFDFTHESVVVRQQLNEAALKLWQQSPILGVGWGNFLVKLPEVLPSRQIYFLQPVHNIYLLILSETGIIGIGLFLWFIIRMLRNFKAFIIYHLSFIIFLILGLVDHYPITLQQGQLLFTLLLALSIYNIGRRSQKS